MIGSLNLYALAGLGCAVLISVGSCTFYKHKSGALGFALETQNAAIAARNEEARSLLELRTRERDELQGSLDKAALAAKGKADAFDKELERLRAAADRPGPVRVRVQSCDAGRGGGGARAVVPGGAQAGAGAPAAASGVLPDANSRRLELALIGIEELSRDFNSCQDGLLARVASERRR